MKTTLVTAAMIVAAGCVSAPPPEATRTDADQLLIVDCLLPGQIRKLGQNFTYLTPRRPAKATAQDCEVRGGEYVAYDRANYATALKVWLAKAKEGDAEAQTYVGEIYEKGLGITPDFMLAAQWYQKAADQGDSRAQINLGYLYERGLGVPRDLVQAMNLYRGASGLTEGNLEFVSSIEMANRAAAQEEQVQLKQQVATLSQELKALSATLAEKQGALNRERDAVTALRKSLAAQEEPAAQKGKIQAAEVVSQSTDTARADAARADLERQLAEIRAEQQRLIAQLAQSQVETARMHRDMDTASAELAKRKRQLVASETAVAQMHEELETLKTASTQVDKHKREQLEAEIAQLRAEIAQLKAVIVTQEQEASRVEAAVDKQRAELSERLSASHAQEQALQQALKARDQEVAALQARLVDQESKLAASAGLEVDLGELRKQLAEREAALKAREREVATLQAQLERAKAANQVSLAPDALDALALLQPNGPTIEILDPPLSVQKNVPSVVLRSQVASVDIVGRVSPSKELLAFRINDQEQRYDNAGLFRANIKVDEPNTPVQVVAVDKAGTRTALDFHIVPGKTTGEQKGSAPLSTVDFGAYHALIIGNQDYQHLPDLKSPAQDARTVEKVLQEKYGFKTQLLLNADRYTLLSTLNRLRESLTETDNLLIYYAGHGELEEVNLRGHWLPADAEPDNNANWISNVEITDILNVMAAKHILVVADSCYSGALTRSSVARLPVGMSDNARVKWYQTMSKAKTRVVLTSGGVKPVLDSGAGQHSIFARAFLDVLNENAGILESYALYRQVQARVKHAAEALQVEQDPQYAPIKYAGHEAGEFFFLPTAGIQTAEQKPVAAVDARLSLALLR